jgi:hypothetical protein
MNGVVFVQQWKRHLSYVVHSFYLIWIIFPVAVMHHITSDVSLAAASVLDSTQIAMDNNAVFFLNGDNQDLASLTNVVWLGVTEEDAINGGPNGISGSNRGDASSGNSVPVAYAVVVPMLLLLALAMLVARQRARRQVTARNHMFALEAAGDIGAVLVGTGDPPRSFHEGLYHYTRHGARYLSTNCPDCIDTLRNGFFTASDLETIDEGNPESFENVSLVETSDSSEKDKSEYNVSDHRKRNLVTPHNTRLGMKHSSIDVHNCNSATCRICSYKPGDLSFVNNGIPMLGSSDGLFEMAEV